MAAFLFLADEKGSDYPGSPRSQGEVMLLHLVYEFAASNNPDMPTTFREIVEKRPKRSSLLEEGIENPGAEARGLLVTLQTDQVEILRHQTGLLKQVIKLLNTPRGLHPEFPLTGHPCGTSTSGSTATASQSTPGTASQTSARKRSRTGLWGRLFQ